MNPKAVEIGKRVRHARVSVGMTQDELGRQVGVSDAAINQYEAGRNLPRLKRLEAIAGVLGVTTAWLLDGGDPDEVVRAQTVTERRALELIRNMAEDDQARALAILAAMQGKSAAP